MPHQGSQPNDLTGQAVMGADYTKSPAELHVISTDSTGALIVSGGGSSGNSAAGPTGSAVPADADYVGFNSGGNLVGVSSSNPLPVAITSIVPDTVNQGNQGTAAEGWFVELTDGTNVLATPSHPVRIDPTGTTVQPINGTVTANVGTTTNTAPATQNITAQDTASTTTAVANGQNFVTGAPTANSAASFALASGFDTVRIQVTGTWTGTLSVEESVDGGTTWVAFNVHQGAYTTGSFTGNFEGLGVIAGCTNVRVRATAAWTGTATIAVVQTISAGAVYVNGPLRLADYTTQSNGMTVKAGSTAALASDTAVVVVTNGSTTASAPSLQTVTSSSGSVLAANTARREATIVNTDVVTLYLGLGQVPTATAYHIALSPCSTAHDGTGGTYTTDLWKGAVNAIAASTSGHLSVTELT